MTFFVAMLLHPDMQKKVQDEIDAVTGRERLPTFEDRPRLPFINAICKELLRWRPVVPLGMSNPPRVTAHAKYRCTLIDHPAIPHAAMRDDIYEGYFIPKGSLSHDTSLSTCC
jgi:hypothetical protein